MDQLLLPLRRYADFSGRSRRREFWSWFLFVWIVLIALIFVDSALGLGGSTSGYAEGGSIGFNATGGVLTLLFALGVLVPNLAVTVRRLHDVGKSGWMILIGLIPLAGWLYLLFLYVQPGTAGPNAYGHDPKGQVSGDVFA
jgi:uncharacterized membrane protein YhaH (DUF805 family)